MLRSAAVQDDEAQLRALPVSRKYPAHAIHCQEDAALVTLRPLRISDTLEVTRAVQESLSELKVFMPWAHGVQSLNAELERRITTQADYWGGRDMNMGLFVSGALVACCGLHYRVPLNPAGIECGYWTRTSQARRGWATLALQMMALYAFDQLDCDRVQVQHNELNLASRRVIAKVGFVLEASLRNATAEPSDEMIAGGLVSSRTSLLWSLVPEDLKSLAWVAALRAQLRYENVFGCPV